MLKDTPVNLLEDFYGCMAHSIYRFLTPNFIAHMPGMLEPLDKEGFKQFTMALYLAFTFSQGSHVFDEVIVAENKVVTCGKFETRHICRISRYSTHRQANQFIDHAH
jgi:hypothetical protein